MTQSSHSHLLDSQTAPFFSERALKAIEGKEPLDQLALLQEYVEQAVRDKQAGYGPPEDDINVVRRRYIRIASELYRGRYVS